MRGGAGGRGWSCGYHLLCNAGAGSLRTEGPQGSPRPLRCRNTRNWRRLGKVMEPRDVPARSFSEDPACSPSSLTVSYTCRLRPQHWAKALAAEPNTRCRHQPFSLCYHLRQTLALSVSSLCGPIFLAAALPAFLTPSLSITCNPHLEPLLQNAGPPTLTFLQAFTALLDDSSLLPDPTPHPLSLWQIPPASGALSFFRHLRLGILTHKTTPY